MLLTDLYCCTNLLISSLVTLKGAVYQRPFLLWMRRSTFLMSSKNSRQMQKLRNGSQLKNRRTSCSRYVTFVASYSGSWKYVNRDNGRTETGRAILRRLEDG